MRRSPLVTFSILGIVAVCAAIALALDPAAAAMGGGVVLRGDAAIEHLKQQGAYDSLAAAMDAAVYAIDRTDRGPDDGHEGAYGAANPANALQTSFSADAVRVRSTGAEPWQLGLRLKGYGYGEDVVGLMPGTMRAQGNRIEIARHAAPGAPPASLLEWYVNTRNGLEQGFTVVRSARRGS